MLPHTGLSFPHALALAVYAATLIAEVLPAPTGHVVAAHSSFDPEVAMRALLVFLAFDKLQEGLVAGTFVGADLELFAGLAEVELHAAVKAVVFLARRTVEFGVVLLLFGIEDKGEFAICRRTP